MEFRLQIHYVPSLGLDFYRFVRENGWPNGRWQTTPHLAWIDLRRLLKAAA